MATIKVKFNPSAVVGHEGTVYYQIVHEGHLRLLFTEYHVFSSEWDADRSMVVAPPEGDRRPVVLSLRERIRSDVERMGRIVGRLDGKGLCYTVDEVVDEFNRCADEYTLFSFMEAVIARLWQNGKLRTAENYRSTLRSFRNFRGQEDIMLDCITSELMEAFEAWHRQRGTAPNTISFYARILRAVYNRAVDEEIIESRNPFRHVYTGVDKTAKRALPLRVIRKIKTLDLSFNPSLDYARDMFMMSFMLRGMSFIDMAFLRKSDLSHGCVTYRRRKTGRRLTIGWTKDMQRILDKYPKNESNYLLPIIRICCTDERTVYRNAGYNINYSLKAIAKMLGIHIPLTLYVARHSWATAAKAKGIPLSVISEGMGHDSEATTQIYLADLDASVVDKANLLILKGL